MGQDGPTMNERIGPLTESNLVEWSIEISSALNVY